MWGKEMANPDIDYVSPNAGGCWYCQTLSEGHWLFSAEFDCYLHLHCLKKELKSIPEGHYKGEVGIFEREFSNLL